MQVSHPFEINVISVRANTLGHHGALVGGGSEDLPAFEIFGTLATQTISAYSLGHPAGAKQSEQRWYFDAVMAVHPEHGRFFVRAGLVGGEGPDYFRDILCAHLNELDLTGTCDTLLPETEEKNI